MTREIARAFPAALALATGMLMFFSVLEPFLERIAS